MLADSLLQAKASGKTRCCSRLESCLPVEFKNLLKQKSANKRGCENDRVGFGECECFQEKH
jgi:hypothetical protein